MNPTLPADYLQRMEQDDPEGYRSEVLGEFRAGVSALFDPEMLEACVVRGVRERRPEDGILYQAAAVLVTTVRENSNASKAGVKAGDVITSLNGGTVTSAADLRRRAQQLESGNEFTLAIVRDKKPMTLKGKVEPAQPRRSLLRTVV
jgi:C-terminal processing protease CtpA/Prc